MSLTTSNDLHTATKVFWADKVDALHRHSDERWFEKYAQELLALLPTGGTLLDVGCGSCQLTTYLAPAFEKVVALDFSDSMLDAARRRIVERKLSNIFLIDGDATRFPDDVRQADVILAYGVVQYLDDVTLGLHLAECARVLAPGGIICWGLVPNKRLRWMWYLHLLNGPRPSPLNLFRHLYHTWGKFWHARKRGDRLWDQIGNWHDPDEIKSRALAAGFEMEIRHSWFYEYRFHTLLRRPTTAISRYGTR